MSAENRWWCVAGDDDHVFQRLCHEAVYIRQHGGARGLRTPNHSSLQCADAPRDLLFLFTLSCPHQGKGVLSGSVRPGSALCAASGGRGSAHSRCRWSPGGGAPAALPFEDNGTGWTGPPDAHFCVAPSCVWCVCFKKEEIIKLHWPFVSFRKWVLEKLVWLDL